MNTQNKPLYIGHAFSLAYMELPDDQRLALFDMVLADFFGQKNLAKTPTEKAMLHLVRGYVEGHDKRMKHFITTKRKSRFFKNPESFQEIFEHSEK